MQNDAKIFKLFFAKMKKKVVNQSKSDVRMPISLSYPDKIVNFGRL